jgi:cysteine synthase A
MELVQAMLAEAAARSARPGCWYFNQLHNADGVAGYLPLGEELWRQSGGRIDAFVHAVSTAHSLHGVTDALWRHDRNIRIVAVEPAESAVLSGGPSGAHRIEGIGIGFAPPLWRRDRVHGIEAVSTDEAAAMARRLAREEGILAGISSGANVVAALRLAARLDRDATVATLVVDSGLRYLSTDLFTGRVGA